MCSKQNKTFNFKYITSSSAAVPACPSDRVESCTDSCGPNTVQRAASTAADDDFIVVETCTDPCGPNTVQRAASTATDDDFINFKNVEHDYKNKQIENINKTNIRRI